MPSRHFLAFSAILLLLLVVLQALVIFFWHAHSLILRTDDEHRSSETDIHTTSTDRNLAQHVRTKLNCRNDIDCIKRLEDLLNNDTSSSRQPENATATTTLSSPSNNDKHQTAALCVIVKDEEPYIDEWIDYNLAIGFDRIYVYDNSDDYKLQHKFKHTNQVVTIHHPGESMQLSSYRHCVKDYIRPNQHTWVGFLDVDEFLILYEHDNVVSMLNDHCPQHSALGIHWRILGTSNKTIHEPLPVTKRFLYRDAQLSPYIKTIAHVSALRHGIMMKDPHYPRLKPDARQIDSLGNTFHGSVQYNTTNLDTVALLYHYKFKSESEFYVKGCVRGRADTTNKTSCVETTRVGEVYDESGWKAMKKYAPKYAVFDEWE